MPKHCRVFCQTGAKGSRCEREEVIYFSRKIREDFTEEVAEYELVGPLRVNIPLLNTPLCALFSAPCFRAQLSVSEMSRSWRTNQLEGTAELGPLLTTLSEIE